MRLFPSYSTTPGLERFPLADRKRVYQEALVKLRKDDPEYARRADRSSRHAIWITMGFVMGSALLNGLEQRKIMSLPVYFPLLSVLVLVYLVVLLRTLRQHQRFLNERVAAVLPGADKGS